MPGRLSLVALLAGASLAAQSVSTDTFVRDVNAFLGKEMAAHIADIHNLNPPQEKVAGALTTGEYSWGTFLRAAAVTGERNIAGRDLPKLQITSTLLNAAVVPTALERVGNVSQDKIQPTDPNTKAPFPGRLIPLTRFDPTALT